jgi:hypothetical protein
MPDQQSSSQPITELEINKYEPVNMVKLFLKVNELVGKVNDLQCNYLPRKQVEAAISKVHHSEYCNSQPANEWDREAPSYFGPGDCDCPVLEIRTTLGLTNEEKELQ